jgi:hypothetical protein
VARHSLLLHALHCCIAVLIAPQQSRLANSIAAVCSLRRGNSSIRLSSHSSSMHFQQQGPRSGSRVCCDLLALCCTLCFGCKRGRVLDAGMQQLLSGNAVRAEARQLGQALLPNPLKYDLTELAGARTCLVAVCLKDGSPASSTVLTCSQPLLTAPP